MRNQLRSLTGAVLLLVALGSGCGTGSSVSVVGDSVSGVGMVLHFDIEGGFFAIRGGDGQTYDPVNLAPDFQHDSLPVRFAGRIRHDLASIHMVGSIIELSQITLR